MINIEKISPRSGLITEELEGQLNTVLGKLTGEVCMVCVINPEEKTSVEMAELVRHMAGLSDKLSCRFYDREEAEKELPELDASLLPVTALYKNDRYTGVAYHGVTGGKEMNSLVFGIYNTAGPGQEINGRMQKKLQKLEERVDIKIFVSLSCHHCAQQVITCQKIASESEVTEARMIDARLYPELAEKYHIERIPMTIVNESEVLMGTKTIEEIYQVMKKCKKQK